ncbi:hydrogenase maturation protease [Ideonella dechloratans]|uniref:Hydrogenase maturation protease n=1 Tax=Ideonella dechloratans TaxID=36863 RepID=A0A643FEI7_IDEDE|nr:hydrogenase maturation protease [Ideonella dechloratans]KAB0583827.1 hydrogenase maturation protease [Ideonella dechloratans]UFU12037.1 hydrogenase maturation protease [Ideonella dechloratans]
MSHGAGGVVLCFGNALHGDDGVAEAVGCCLVAAGLPPGWSVQAVGTRGLDALAWLMDAPAVVLVDAAEPAGQPGRLAERDPAQVPLETAAVGHGMGLGHLLRAWRAARPAGVPARLLTIEMAALRSFHLGLSPAVAQAVAPAARMVADWLADRRWQMPAVAGVC